ncbi:unnamed protein product [Ectocarpus sp. 6 AP-2014]
MGWGAWSCAVLLGAVGAVGSVVWIGLLVRLHVLRHEFEIAARSPQLVILTGFTCYLLSLSVVVQWMLLCVGTNIPCWVVIWVSYAVFALGIIPYFIRVVRLVVAYNQSYRAKFARFVKWTPMMRIWAGASIGLVLRAAFFFGSKPVHFSSNAHECFYFDDIVLMTGACAFAGVPILLIARSLIHVFDAFRIRQEMERAIGICMSLSMVIVLLQVLVYFEVMADSSELHFAVEAMAFLFGIQVFTHGLIVPLLAHYKEYGWVNPSVLPVEDEPSSNDDVDGVHALAVKGGDMAERFGRFVQENLCMESWDFIVDAVKYEMESSCEPDDQFEEFLILLNQYLLPTSPDEVNISSKMSKRMASFKTREAFTQLDREERRGILKEPLDEIVRMLEQNLLNKFQSRIALEREAKREAQQAEAKGDPALMALMKVSQTVPRSKPSSQPTNHQAASPLSTTEVVSFSSRFHLG